MRLKTLFLGSAAVFAVGGAAQAADLSVAEPVEYVRVCDGFGAGYWVIPGSDTCLKIGGSVEFDVNLHSNAALGVFSGTHSSVWDFHTTAKLNFTAKSMTEYGELTGYIAFRGDYNANSQQPNGDEIGKASGVWLDDAYLKIGALLAGKTESILNISNGGDYYATEFAPDYGANQLRLTWAAAGFGLMLAVEEPTGLWGSSLPSNVSMPVIAGKITASQTNWNGALAAGFTQGGDETLWVVNGNLGFNLGANDKLQINGVIGSQGFVTYTKGVGMFDSASDTNVWAVFGAWKHIFTPQFSTDLTLGYAAANSNGENDTAWQVSGDLVWSPVKNFSTTLAGRYVNTSDDGTSTSSWNATVALVRSW